MPSSKDLAAYKIPLSGIVQSSTTPMMSHYEENLLDFLSHAGEN